MDDDVPPGIGGRSEPRPTAMTSTVHPRFRPRSQITVLDVDLASALSVAPAPHSWKDAEERVLSEFGGDISSPPSVAADTQSPHKGYFVDDLNASNDSLSSACSNSTLNDDPHPPSMSTHRSPSPEVFGTVPVHCVRVIDPDSRRNSGESFYAYFIEDGDAVYDPPEDLAIPRPTTVDRGRFREVVSVQDPDLIANGYHAKGLGGENSSSSDQEGVPSPAIDGRPSGDKRRNRISQVIVDASKRSKRRMTSCTIQ